MKNIYKKFFAGIIFTAILFVPFFSFAQEGQTLNINGDIAVTQVTDQYSVHATLHEENINSFSGLSLIAIVDQDEINPPFSFAQIVSITNFNQATGNFDINFVLNFNPTAYAFQFFLVNNVSLAGSGGVALFNPANNSNYLVFIPTTIYWYNLPDTNPGDQNPNNPDPQSNVDCTLPENQTDPACPNPAGNEFNPNYTFTSHIINPLGEGNNFDIFGFLEALFNNIVKIAIPFMVLFMIYSGFLFVEARGDTEKLATARKNFLYVIIGSLLILGAWTIAHVLKGTVDQIQAYNFIKNTIINLV